MTTAPDPQHPWPRVGLVGERLDLDTLANVHEGRDPGVIGDGDDYYLVDSGFAELETQPVELVRRAQELLALMNGAARVAHGNHQNVDVEGTIHHNEGRRSAVVFAETAVARARAGTPTVALDAQHAPAPPALENTALDTAFCDDHVATALRLIANGLDDWPNLYRVFELARKGLGGEARIIELGAAAASDINRFRFSANRPDSGGDGARHGYLPGERPKDTPMSIPDGKRFVRGLVQAWINPPTNG